MVLTRNTRKYITLEFFNDVRAVINVSNLSLVTLVSEIKKRKMSMFFFKILPHSHCFSISSFLEISTSCYFLLFSHQISSSNFDTSLWSATLDLINFLTQHFFLQPSWNVASCQRFRTIILHYRSLNSIVVLPSKALADFEKSALCNIWSFSEE